MESSTKDVEVDIGENYDLVCKAQGYPKPKIAWIRADSKPLYDGSARYNVKNRLAKKKFWKFYYFIFLKIN